MSVPSETTIGYIKATQSKFESGSLVQVDVDLAFFVSSWEPRCLEFTRVGDLQSKFGALIRFQELGSSGRRVVHDAELRNFLAENTHKILKYNRFPSTFESRHFEEIRAVLLRTKKRLGRPFSVFLDASCMPKIYMLYLAAICFNQGLVSSMHVFYSQANYSEDGEIVSRTSRSLNKTYNFTEGEWRGVIVPYLERGLNPGKVRKIFVSLGFEGGRLYRFVKDYEPDEIKVVICDPGFTANYTHEAEKQNDLLLRSFEISGANVKRAAAADMISVLNYGSKDWPHNPDFEQSFFMCLGTKPHALGLGLASLVRGGIPVVTRLPERFVEKNTEASGINWLYSITDLSTV